MSLGPFPAYLKIDSDLFQVTRESKHAVEERTVNVEVFCFHCDASFRNFAQILEALEENCQNDFHFSSQNDWSSDVKMVAYWTGWEIKFSYLKLVLNDVISIIAGKSAITKSLNARSFP